MSDSSPSRIGPSGTKYWYKSGTLILHREDGPAIVAPNGSKFWYLNGERHRIGGPAVKWNDETKGWWLDGERHRIDGPAIEYASGYKDWYLSGRLLDEEEHTWLVSKGIYNPDEIPEEYQTEYILRFS